MKTNFKKINTFLVVLFSMGSYQANAQTDKGGYVSINTGYSMGTGKADYYQGMLVRMINYNETSATTSTTEFVRANLGKGIHAGANFGYMLNKNMGVELGINYLLGGKTNASMTSYTGDYGKSEISGKMLQIKPTLVFRGGFDKINPYAKVGMIIGSGKITNTQEYKDGVDFSTRTLELNEGIPVGFHASLGTLYKLNEKLSLFGELSLVSLEYAPKKGHFTVATKNGIDELPTMPISDKEFDFVEDYTKTGAPYNPNEPGKNPILPFSFSSFGVNIGLQYNF